MLTSTLTKGLKNFSTTSLHRNFGACSVLMVNKAVTDPIQKLFLDKLKEYSKLSVSGKLVEITPEKQKEYDETLSNLKKAYGADKDDYSKFPSFVFNEPKLDPINMEEKA